MADNLGICDTDSMTNCKHLSYHQNPWRKNCSHNTPAINKPAKRGRHSLRKQSKYAYGLIPLSRYMSYNKGFHAPALMEGSILWRSTSWSCPNQSMTCRIFGANSSTSFGVREIRAVSAKRDTSGGSREDWVVVVEHLRTLLFLSWLITTFEKLKLELLLLLLLQLKLKIWFFGAILDTPFSISNALLPIFLENLVQL